MSRIDIITIAIVGVCLIALIYLLSQIANINNPKPSIAKENNTLKEDSSALDSIGSQALEIEVDSNTNANLVTEPITKEQPVNQPAKTDPAGRFLVVAASFNTLELAEQEQKRLAKLGYDNSEIGYFNQRKIVAVIIGRYDDYDVADEIAKKMKSKHKVDAYVHRKR
ncbi:MAG: hypothetical protein Sapg2KO_11610 [Saprospiraceae bacterium]